MDTQQLIRNLKTVPETKLELIRLSWEVVDEQGRLDLQKAAFIAKEINLARDEAQAYISANQRVKWTLRNIVKTTL